MPSPTQKLWESPGQLYFKVNKGFKNEITPFWNQTVVMIV